MSLVTWFDDRSTIEGLEEISGEAEALKAARDIHMQSKARAMDGVEPHSAQTDYESGPLNAVQATKTFEMMGGFEMTSVEAQSCHLMIERCQP